MRKGVTDPNLINEPDDEDSGEEEAPEAKVPRLGDE
jgi:hypothetical protein